VHLSDVNSREEFRRHSFVSLVAKKTIAGLGFEGYKLALEYFA
jgi:3-dehydroquinate dehydratase-2